MWSVLIWNLNAEQAREVFHAAHEILFAVTEQPQFHTQLYARLWRYLSSYSKLVDLCVWILFKCHQKLKVSCIVVFEDEGILYLLQRCWVGGTGPIRWTEISCDFTLLVIFWRNIAEHKNNIQTFEIVLTDGHTAIDHVLRSLSSGIVWGINW